MIIKNTTRLGSLIKEYPQVQISIAAILPDFGSLEQPHLRETVLSITTIEHLAQKTGREVSEIVADLYQTIGIKNQADDIKQALEYLPDDPEWIKQEPQHRIDGVELLAKGEHPLNTVQENLKNLPSGGIILLLTNFHPQPMLDTMQSAGVKTYSRKDTRSQNQVLTFIKK